MTHPADTRRSATPEQHDAITTLDRNVVVVAGAGTGKTFVLVRRFVEQFEKHRDWPIGAVVAITVTNRAAGEMLARVRAELESRRRESRTDADRRHWAALLTQIEAARITTIHGLCSEIIRANSASAAIDPGFEVLDETQSGLLRERAVSLALAEASGSGEMLIEEELELASRVIVRYGENEIRDVLTTAQLLSADLNEPRGMDALYQEWNAHTKHLLNSVEWAPLTYEPPVVEDKTAALYRGMSSTLAVLTGLGNSIDIRVSALNDLVGVKFAGGAISVKLWPEAKEARKELFDLRNRAETLAKRLLVPPSEQDEVAAGLLQGWHLLIGRTRYHYSALKQQRSALDYDDLERLAAHVLALPDVRSRYVGTEFRHVMVDEFQDTNDRQWEIVRAIAPPDRPGALFLVGDPKQSIYGFRGADVTVFETARQDIKAHGGVVQYLTLSFRTHKALIDSLNQVFRKVLVSPADAPEPEVYVRFDPSQELRSGRLVEPAAPYIQVFGVNKNGRDSEFGREVSVIARRIKELVGSRAPLVWQQGEYHPVRFGDIAVLLRKFQGKVGILERALNEEGIPYVTLGGRGFFGRREVRDLISALTALHNPADELALASALHSPLFGVSDVDLLRLRRPVSVESGDAAKTLTLIEALHREASVRRGHSIDYDSLVYSADVFEQLEPLVGRTPVDTLLQALIQATGYMATLAGLPDGQQMRANVEKLIDRARESGLTALNQFIHYLRDMTEAEAKEGGVALEADDAVRVTTIHSSKGLEYPVVWIANASGESASSDRSLLNWTDELGCQMPSPDQLLNDPDDPRSSKLHPYVYRRNQALKAEREKAESLRLFYVAATRAQDALFVSGILNKDASARGWLGATKDELPFEELDVPPDRPQSSEIASADDETEGILDFPLARTLPAAPPPRVLHLSASDVIALGGYNSAPDEKSRGRYAQRLRRRVFDERSEPVPLLTYDSRELSQVARRVGTLIHDALRYGYDTLVETDEPQVTDLVRAMAWETGITQAEDLSKAVHRVISSLRAYRRSTLCKEIERSSAVYRELPFVFQRDSHVIHGVIDLLYRAPDGTWTVVDYKTDRVEADKLELHARAYYLQMAVYAEAVAAHAGKVPRVMLVFLHHPNLPIVLKPADLRAELDKVPLKTLIEMLREDT